MGQIIFLAITIIVWLLIEGSTLYYSILTGEWHMFGAVTSVILLWLLLKKGAYKFIIHKKG